MAYALQIPCITLHYFPDTLENIKKLCSSAGYQASINENATCCGLPYFEKGELKSAKTIGEYNLKVYGSDAIISISPKCHKTFTEHYPNIFNNTVSHNDAMHLAKHIINLETIISKINTDKFKSVQGKYFYVRECCRTEALDPETIGFSNIEWMYSPLSATCCGAGTSFPVSQPELAKNMAMALIEAFKASGADAMVFEDDVCRKHVQNVIGSDNITTYHIIDIIAKAL